VTRYCRANYRIINPQAKMHQENPRPFDALTPDFILQAVESQDLICDGRIFPLNSYENRVYQVGIEDSEPLIAKFYRPGRWTEEQIREEHEFCFELVAQELPVVAPLTGADEDSVLQRGDFLFALFPRRGGRAPELDNLDNLLILGRLLGRIHRIGASKSFEHRPLLDSASYGYASMEFIVNGVIPIELEESYQEVASELLTRIDSALREAGPIRNIRVHGDCHIGNMLWRDDAPHFVDFDDTRMAPAVQDLWMLLSGDRREQTIQLDQVLTGYCEFADFNYRELRLVEALRSLRMLYYSAWLARRWDDPAFPQSFPWFNTRNYWEGHVADLRAQVQEVNEQPLLL
jgi:Ser/Thr protein kinase RdoA (MazF antagonist)